MTATADGEDDYMSEDFLQKIADVKPGIPSYLNLNTYVLL